MLLRHQMVALIGMFLTTLMLSGFVIRRELVPPQPARDELQRGTQIGFQSAGTARSIIGGICFSIILLRRRTILIGLATGIVAALALLHVHFFLRSQPTLMTAAGYLAPALLISGVVSPNSWIQYYLTYMICRTPPWSAEGLGEAEDRS